LVVQRSTTGTILTVYSSQNQEKRVVNSGFLVRRQQLGLAGTSGFVGAGVHHADYLLEYE
jgi:hypothetical protein